MTNRSNNRAISVTMMLSVIAALSGCGGRTEPGLFDLASPDGREASDAATEADSSDFAPFESGLAGDSSGEDSLHFDAIEDSGRENGETSSTVACFGDIGPTASFSSAALEYVVCDGDPTCEFSLSLDEDCHMSFSDSKVGFVRVLLAPAECNVLMRWVASSRFNEAVVGSPEELECAKTRVGGKREWVRLAWGVIRESEPDFCDADPWRLNRECLRQFREKYTGIATIP